ncbi:Alcohol dehydrogenase superfamily protein [Mycena venus]|uniref:Alcohol dehydrogenase superfamily protein n=1 Tax=Mycena venus TaxID=2733690 RepID=A0A8H7DE42_9AGAR|nr:Alcohol dehydrogenase superfamily protein [Mycena venus]
MTIPTVAREYFYPQFGSYNNLVLREVPVPVPKDNEVLVRIHAVSLQFRDLVIARDEFDTKRPDNLIPCSDTAGEVVAVGNDVTQWAVGDRVSANLLVDKIHDGQHSSEIRDASLGRYLHGVLREYRTFAPHSLVAVPSHMSYEEASTLPCAGVTAYNALLGGFKPLKAGDTILIQGTGGVSIFALQFAVASGATVIATSSDDKKLELVSKLGAKHTINYKKTPDWDKEVLRLTHGVGVDRVIEVAGNSTIQRSINSTRLNGSIDLIGFVGGMNDVVPPDVVGPCLFKGLTIRGIAIGSVQQFKDMNMLLAANIDTTRPVIDRIFPFEEAKAALAYFETQAHVGKVVVKV